MDIVDPANMTPGEVKAVCQFLIDYKKKGQFRTFWDGFQNGVGILTSGEVLLSSCWEPMAMIKSLWRNWPTGRAAAFWMC